MFSSFKSDNADFYSSIMKQLDYLLNEQRLQRQDLAELLRLAHTKATYYTKPLEDYGSTSPQTDQDEQ